MNNIAIIYQYYAHYRRAVMQALCQDGDQEGVRFHFFSDEVSNIPSIKLFDTSLASASVDKGGVRWTKVKNYWLKDWVLWQSGVVKLAIGENFSTIIFLGDRRYLSTWIGALLAKMRGKKVFFWSHGYKRIRGGLQGFIIRCFYRIPHAHLFYGHRAAELAVQSGLDASRLFVIYNSLDFDAQQTYASQVSEIERMGVRNGFSQPDAPLLIMSGRLTAPKKVDWVLRAQSKLLKKGRDLNLLVVGDGPEAEVLKELAEQLGISSRVRFYGPCYDERKLATIFLAGDVFVLPGTLGLSCMHAMGYGLPVISHDDMDFQNPEVEAIVPGKTGDLYKVECLDSLVDTIGHWVDRVINERETIRQACLERIESTYTATNQVRCILNALNEMDAK